MKYHARRILTGEWLHRDLDLRNVEVTRTLSGPGVLTAQVEPELQVKVHSDGLRILEEWATILYRENDSGRITGHGIVIPPAEYENAATSLTCMGVSGYPNGFIYEDSRNWGPTGDLDRPDPLKIVQDLWAHVQSFPNSKLGVRLVGTLSSRERIGDFEEPYRLRWWEAPDVGQEIDSLAEETPFDYAEEVSWSNPGHTEVDHRVRLGWPRLGTSRNELRFALGENIVEPTRLPSQEDFANNVIGIGNGTGASMVTARASVRDGRLRRTFVYTDKTVRQEARLQRRVTRILNRLGIRVEVPEILIVDHPNARISAIGLGDDIYVQTFIPAYGEFRKWARVVAITQGDDENFARLALVPSSEFQYSPSDGSDTGQPPVNPPIILPPDSSGGSGPPPDPEDPEPEVFTGLVLVGVETATNVASIPLPTGTALLDLVFVAAHGANSGGRNALLGAGAMADERMLGHYGGLTGDHWWGIATDLTDVGLAIPLNGAAIIATFRDAANVPLGFGTAVGVTKGEDTADGGEDIEVVSLDSPAVVALSTYDQGSGTDTQFSLYPDYTPAVPDPDLSQRAGGIDYWEGTGGSPASTWSDGAYQRYDRSVVLVPIDVSETPPPTGGGGGDDGGGDPPTDPPTDPPDPEDPPPSGGGWSGSWSGPMVTPKSSKKAHEGYGICQHVNFQSNNIHTWQAAIMARYGQMKVHQMRSMYGPNSSTAFAAAVAGCRAYGIKWNATVASRNETTGLIEPSESAIRTRIRTMAEQHSDIIGAIEGINEPNYPADPSWVAKVLRAQWVIWDEWKKHDELRNVKVLSPSMHDTRLDDSDGEHWDLFANGTVLGDDGITYTGKQLCHMAAVHSYPAGSLPDTNLADRVQWVYDAFGANFPIKLTEWGYTTTLGSGGSGGHKVVNEAAAAAYDAQGILDMAKSGYEVLRYEMMDDPDPENNDTEKNFGLWRVQSLTGNPDTTWEAKPSVHTITEVLTRLKDPGAPYTPFAVPLDLSDVPAGVRTLVTQKRNGATTLWMWRHTQMWNPNTEVPIPVGTLACPVTDIAGERTINVGMIPVPVAVRLTVGG